MGDCDQKHSERAEKEGWAALSVVAVGLIAVLVSQVAARHGVTSHPHDIRGQTQGRGLLAVMARRRRRRRHSTGWVSHGQDTILHIDVLPVLCTLAKFCGGEISSGYGEPQATSAPVECLGRYQLSWEPCILAVTAREVTRGLARWCAGCCSSKNI